MVDIMGKLINKRFLFILGISVISLVMLIGGMFYLFDDSDNIFVKSGYILNPMSANSTRYYFDKGTSYHTNLSSLIVFNDVDKDDVKVNKDSFVHYLDGDMSFLKNGAILDLGTINKSMATYYNITDKSLVKYSNGGYTIDNKDDVLTIENFIGRISDNRYIVAGTNVRLVYGADNIETKGDYFEITYVENGVVNIENQEVKLQMAAQDAKILVNDDIVISLGAKKINYGTDGVMSITEITIDGNENIEVIPKDEYKDNSSSSNGGNSSSNGSSGGNQGNGGSSGNGNGGTGGDGNSGTGGNGGGSDDKPNSVIDDYNLIKLKDVKIDATTIEVMFDISDKLKEQLILQVINTATGKRIYTSILSEDVKIESLTPNSNYLFTVSSSNGDKEYYQGLFRTDVLGVELTKVYATSSSLTYKVKVMEESVVSDLTLKLYRFDSESNEEVFISSYDIKAEDAYDGYTALFDNLDSNTIYTAVIDDISLNSYQYVGVYTISNNAITLKEIPNFNNLSVLVNAEGSSFELSIKDIQDKDNAITRYTYNIYRKEDVSNNVDDLKTIIKPITKNNASSVSVLVDNNDPNKLSSEENYVYNVVIEYFDNEKYVEYASVYSDDFIMSGEAKIIFERDDELTTYNKIVANIKLVDNSCIVFMDGRTNCNLENNIYIKVSEDNNYSNVSPKIIPIEFDLETLTYKLELNDLIENTRYRIEVFADIDRKDGNGVIFNSLLGQTIMSTKALANLNVSFEDAGSSELHPINSNIKFNPVNGTSDTQLKYTKDALKRVDVYLYYGNVSDNVNAGVLLGNTSYLSSNGVNIGELFYENKFNLTNGDVFGLNLDDLRNEDGELSPYYTIAVYAYYDEDGKLPIVLNNNIYAYKINELLLMGKIEEPKLLVNPISNGKSNYRFDKLIDDSTVVGYKLTAAFDKLGLENHGFTIDKFNIYVYLKSELESGIVKPVDFYILEDGKLKRVNTVSVGNPASGIENTIYMDYGSEYDKRDDIMSRGNEYVVSYVLGLTKDGVSSVYPTAKEYEAGGVFTTALAEKESPNIKLYPLVSDKSSITYKYNIVDVDKALSDNKLYSNVNDVVSEYSLESNLDGSFKVSGLTNDSIINIYYNKNVSKTNSEKDFVEDNFFEYKYDGEYKLDNNLSYVINNNSSNGNRVNIKLVGEDEILNRVLSYEITLTDSKDNIYKSKLWNLNKCLDDDTNRCIYIDYMVLKNLGMQSSVDKVNPIKVSIKAYYDSGLIGYELKSDYYIFQNNSTSKEDGSYIGVNNYGNVILWNKDLGFGKGYYTYTLGEDKSGKFITLVNKDNNDRSGKTYYDVTSAGFVGSKGTMVPKGVSVNNVSTDNATFSFSSIVPKISIDSKAVKLDGTVISMTVDGYDPDYFVNENGKHYFYIDVYENESDVGNDSLIRRKIKVDYDNINEIVIDGLENNKRYYYTVNAYLYYNNKAVYTRLYDAKYDDDRTELYTFRSLDGSDIFNRISVDLELSKDKGYSDRQLRTTLTFIKGEYNDYPFNFDIQYVLCNKGSQCSLDSEDKVLDGTISSSSIKGTTASGLYDLSNIDMVYGTNYIIKAYAVYNNLDVNGNVVGKYEVLLNSKDDVYLRELEDAKFSLLRSADYIDGKYVIDATINVSDKDHVLKNGVYYVKLVDEDNNVVGKLKYTNSDGEVVTIDDYENYALDVSVINRKITFTDLKPETRYTIIVYGESYRNNYNLSDEEKNSHVEVSRSLYSSNDYGISTGTIVFSATERSFVVIFSEGVNLSRITKVFYKIHTINDLQYIPDDSYDIGADGKKFERSNEDEDFTLTINPEGIVNQINSVYVGSVSFIVKDDEGNLHLLESPKWENKEFAYTKDTKKG